jgi:hypothetical protein
MKITGIWRHLLALATLAVIWASVTPAQAQVTAGCSCPAGFPNARGTTCFDRSFIANVPAICPLRTINIGQIAASQQQQSFWGINQMLQQKRDHLQYTPIGRTTSQTTSNVTGYAPSTLDNNATLMSYSGQPNSKQAKKTDPFAGLTDQTTPAPTTPLYGAWVQGLVDWERDSALNAADLGRSNTTYTAQGGIDRTFFGVLSAEDAFVFGLVGSETSSHVDFFNSPSSLRLDGPGVGAYSEYVKGGFSADLTAKFDFLQLTEDAGAAAPVGVSVLNSGVSGNVQYKFSADHNSFFEPTMGFTLTHTSFGNGAAALDLQDAYTVRLQAGARVGTTWDFGRGVSVDGNVKVLAYGNAIAQGTAIGTAIGGVVLPIAPTDQGQMHGEVDPELCFNLPNEYSVTLSGQGRFGGSLTGGSVGLNLRKQW